MKKRLLLILMIPAIWAFLMWPALAQEDIATIRDNGFQKRQRPPAVFKHDEHNETAEIEECNECHHIYEDGKNTWKDGMAVARCGECHDEPTIKSETKLPPEDQKKNLKLAFHNNCRACHKALKKENPETKAPVTCKQCHPTK